ncbi:MAG: hypothetical protein IPJ82_20920 [Lewinellaceae bacterium]|nr:hypothetical protein [Lewinellaceae bacterium]
MSYLLAHEGLIPDPNGTLTLQQLTTQLNSTTPPFCAKITSNCVNVTINPIPPDTEEFQTICAPQCFTFTIRCIVSQALIPKRSCKTVVLIRQPFT